MTLPMDLDWTSPKDRAESSDTTVTLLCQVCVNDGKEQAAKQIVGQSHEGGRVFWVLVCNQHHVGFTHPNGQTRPVTARFTLKRALDADFDPTYELCEICGDVYPVEPHCEGEE